MKKENKKLGELLLEAGLIDEFQLKAALAEQAEWSGRVGSIMIKKGFVSERDMIAVIEKQYGHPAISLDDIETPADEVLKMVGKDVAKRFGIFPLGLEGRTLLIAIADPTDLKMIDDIGFNLGVRVKPMLALESDIMRAIGIYYEGNYPGGSFHMAKERLNAFDASAAALATGAGYDKAAQGSETGEQTEKKSSRPKTEIPLKVVIDGLIEVLVSKGIMTREELIKVIKSRGRF